MRYRMNLVTSPQIKCDTRADMKVQELFEGVLTEAESAEVDMVIDKLVDMIFEEGEAATGSDPSPTQAPTEPAGPGGPGAGGTTGPTGHMHGGWGGGNRFASAWFATFAGQLMWLTSATKIKKRLKQIGVKGEGARRLENAIKIANNNINLLLNNPGWRQQTWTFAGGPGAKQSKAVVASMSKLLGSEIKKASKKHKKKIRESLDEGWKANVAGAAIIGGAMLGAASLPKVEIEGQTYDVATGRAPEEAKTKSVTINGKKVKVKYWASPGPKHGRVTYVYSVVKNVDEGWKENVLNTAVAGALAIGGAHGLQNHARAVAPTVAHVEGDTHEYLPAKGPVPNGVKAQTTTATIDGKKVKIKYWSQRDMKYTNYYYEKV